MTELKIPIPKDLEEKMRKHPEINWASIASNAIQDRLKMANHQEIDVELETYISHISRLGHDWDGQGAEPFDKKTIEKAKNLVIKIMNSFAEQEIELSYPKLFPVANGSIDISLRSI